MLLVDRDECPRATDYETLSRMPGAFKKGGLGTAGNASIISDGAAATVVMSRARAEALGCPILATVGAQASAAIDMKYVLVAPIWAIPKCLGKEGIGLADVDLYEVNEAFSGSTVAVLRELDLDPARVNVNGGGRLFGSSHRGFGLPGPGDPDPRDDPPGQADRPGLSLPGRRRGGGAGGQTPATSLIAGPVERRNAHISRMYIFIYMSIFLYTIFRQPATFGFQEKTPCRLKRQRPMPSSPSPTTSSNSASKTFLPR